MPDSVEFTKKRQDEIKQLLHAHDGDSGEFIKVLKRIIDLHKLREAICRGGDKYSAADLRGKFTEMDRAMETVLKNWDSLGNQGMDYLGDGFYGEDLYTRRSGETMILNMDAERDRLGRIRLAIASAAESAQADCRPGPYKSKRRNERRRDLIRRLAEAYERCFPNRKASIYRDGAFYKLVKKVLPIADEVPIKKPYELVKAGVKRHRSRKKFIRECLGDE